MNGEGNQGLIYTIHTAYEELAEEKSYIKNTNTVLYTIKIIQQVVSSIRRQLASQQYMHQRTNLKGKCNQKRNLSNTLTIQTVYSYQNNYAMTV